ncbi:MAG: hypothetical protein VYC17_01125 [Nitrospinota bacterium]|nr:hypothetical protein [Nitrospinota bacterium]
MLLRRIIILLSTLCITLTACTHIFEHNSDVQARQALLDLMEIQETYHKEHGHYAKDLVEAGKYGLQYHSGIVYLEIQYAEKDEYRAISLPAESVTARVFAYETQRGGFYEMDEEIPEYVLGALNFIRGEQRQKNTTDFFSAMLVVILVVMGLKSLRKGKTGKFCKTHYMFFLNMVPLCWALAIINHMDENMVFSPLLQGIAIGSILISGICLVACGKAIGNFIKEREPPTLVGILFSMAITSILSLVVVIHTLIEFYND